MAASRKKKTIEQPLVSEETKWLASNVCELRKRLNLSVDQVALAIGISSPSLREIERGNVNSPSYLNVHRLAKLYGVPPHRMASEDLTKLNLEESDKCFMEQNFGETEWDYIHSFVCTHRTQLMERGRFREK